jgi:HlyD family secretion protein
MKKTSLFLALAGILALLSASAIPAVQGPPAKVAAVKVQKIALNPMFDVLGNVEPVRSVELSTDVEGLVEEIAFDEGDRVQEGQVLLRLRDSQKSIELRIAKARLDTAQGMFEEFKNGSRKEDIQVAEADVAEARALLTDAEEDLGRILELAKDKIASAKEVSSARALAASRKAQLEARVAGRDLVRSGPRREVIARARAQVAERQAEVERIQDELSKMQVKAPFTGAIVEKKVEKGRYVRRGDTLLTLVQMDPIQVAVSLPERLLIHVRRGKKLGFRLDGLPGQRFEGEIHRIIPRADSLARTIPVKLRLDNAKHLILPGMVARAEVPSTDGKPGLIIPWDALVRSPRGTMVYRIKEGKAEPVPVQLTARKGEQIQVTGPLAEGDLVVTRGNERLRPGQAVVVMQAPAKGEGHDQPQGRK